MAVLLGFFYFDQRKENAALRIKMISMSTPRRIPKTWSQITSQLPTPKLPSAPKTQVKKVSPVPLVDLPIEVLATDLNNGMANVKEKSKEELDKNIEIANEVISREPASYSAHKAKLISLLTKEGKYKEKIDDTEVNQLLETMAEFDTNSDANARKEAVLIANTNNQAELLNANLQSISSERINIDNQMQQFDTYTRQWGELNKRRDELLKKEEQAAAELDQYNEQVQASVEDIYAEQPTNEDIVDIPFMRLLSQNQYAQAEDEAETFIEQFPTSISGYFYLIRSLELQGRGGEIPEIIRSSQLSPDAQDTLLDRLDKTRNANPEDYWERLSY